MEEWALSPEEKEIMENMKKEAEHIRKMGYTGPIAMWSTVSTQPGTVFRYTNDRLYKEDPQAPQEDDKFQEEFAEALEEWKAQGF